MLKILIYIAIYLNLFYAKAQISFESYKKITVPSWPSVVAIGDVNNDGLNDVVLGTGYYFDPVNDYKIFVFLQNSFGNLNTAIKYSYPGSPQGLKTITIKDVNNDNLNDVIIGYSDSIGVYFQNNSGLLNNLKGYYSGTYVDGVKCGDLNSDGLQDIAVSHWSDNFIRIFYQNNTGFNSVTYNKPSNTGYDEIDVGDVNGDNLSDVVFMAGQGIGGIHVFTQTNTGTLNNYVSYFPINASYPSLHGIAIGDVDNDGKNEVVASLGGNSPSSKIVIWKQNNTTGQFNNSPIYLNAYDIPEPIEISDFNCDNKNEIITVHGGWMNASVYEQDNFGGFNTYSKFQVPYASHYLPNGLAVGDINNDGRKDVALADYNNGLVLLYNNTKPLFIDTVNFSISIDTIYHHNFTISNVYIDTTVTYINDYRTTTIDSFSVNFKFVSDSIRFDSTTITHGEICGRHYFDTIFHSEIKHEIRLINNDTVFIKSKKYSVNLINEISVFPIPAENEISLLLPSPYDSKSLILNMLNELGQNVLTKSFDDSSNKRILNLSQYSSGVYFLNFIVGSSNPIIIKKILITH